MRRKFNLPLRRALAKVSGLKVRHSLDRCLGVCPLSGPCGRDGFLTHKLERQRTMVRL